MNTLKFRIAAKTDIGLVRQNNEDNFQASSDLNSFPMRWVNNEICSLGEKGALLVVADGMGGMNAGEVASEIAIETVKEYFLPENITDEVTKNRYSIEKFMNSSIEEADARIKKEAKNNPESRGMGTTIVIGWIFDNKLYVSWCGDSRAYVYNPKAGLHQISKDHSYVQSLVDKGAITKEDAFDYPESNIITRCLCDSSTKAKPESLLSPYEICNDDIIILCTDGLCGMIRDNEIENIIRNNEHDMDGCTDLLIQAACDAEGSDNITICVAQILQGAKECDPSAFEPYDKRLAGPINKADRTNSVISASSNPQSLYKKILIGLLIIFVVSLAALFIWKFNTTDKTSNIEQNESEQDTTICLVDCNGDSIIVERSNGVPQIGDKASPDGVFRIDSTTIEIVNGSITKIDSTRTINNMDSTPSTSDADSYKDSQKNNAKGREDKGILKNIDGEGILKNKKVKDDSEEEAKEDSLTLIHSDSDDDSPDLKFTIHVVKKGETLTSIAKIYNVEQQSIRDYNKDVDLKILQIGTKLRIPVIRVK